jgi:membrane fusion protein (multidrug efflux system)
VSTDHVWVEARFKEKQVARIARDQPVRVVIDAFEPQVFSGRVESIAGATASQFAGAPLEGTSTRFVRVSQRVPVRVALDSVPARAYAGLSAIVTVDVTGSGP